MALRAQSKTLSANRRQIGVLNRACVITRSSVAVNEKAVGISRRRFVDGAIATSLALSMSGPAFAKGIKGFNPVEDGPDGYRFQYPFGWQEVTVSGADVVYKDIVEPLETVSVTLLETDKKDVAEYGPVEEVAETLAKNVLTAPGTEVKVLSSSQREDDKGRKYYEFEFTASKGFTRHQLAVVAVANGKFYTLTTGCSERRWGRMKEKLETTIKSFSLV